MVHVRAHVYVHEHAHVHKHMHTHMHVLCVRVYVVHKHAYAWEGSAHTIHLGFRLLWWCLFMTHQRYTVNP